MARGGLPAAPNSNPRLPRAIAYCRPKMVLTMGSTLVLDLEMIVVSVIRIELSQELANQEPFIFECLGTLKGGTTVHDVRHTNVTKKIKNVLLFEPVGQLSQPGRPVDTVRDQEIF